MFCCNILIICHCNIILENHLMISYHPFWDTLNRRNMSTYDLIYKNGMSANTIHRIKHNCAITTNTINELCFIMHCGVSEIIEYVDD